MARACTICEHSERDSIDAALVCGEPMNVIAKLYGVGKDAARRHRVRHLSPALAAMQGERTRAVAKTTLERMEVQYGILADVVQAARDGGQSKTIIDASRELRQTAELLAKITGELNERPQIAVNVLSSPEIQQAIATVLEVTPEPERRQRLAALLQPERLQLEAPR